MTPRLRIPAATSLLVALALALSARVVAVPIIGPLRVVLLVDSSASVSTMLNPLRASLLTFIDNLPGSPEVIDAEMTLISSGGQLRIRVPTTTDRVALRKAAAAFAPDGGANAFVDSMLEADKRFLQTAPERRSVFVIVMTDNSSFRGEARVDAYNKFARNFVNRGGRAHGIVISSMNSGIHSDILANITGNTGGYYDTIAIANALPDKMKYMAAMVAADIP